MKTCKLCKRAYHFLAQSHIIPKAIYSYVGIRDAQQGILLYDFVLGKSYRSPQGEYDKEILCQKCESLINERYETDALRVLYQSDLPERLKFTFAQFSDSNGVGIKFQDLSYKTIKMFFVSLLWRAHLSKRPFWSRVSLPKEEAEELRNILLNDGVLPEDRYPITIYSFFGENLPSLVSQPRPLFNVRTKEIVGYVFLIGKAFHFIHKHKDYVFPNTENYSINSRGEMQILQIDAKGARQLMHACFGKELF